MSLLQINDGIADIVSSFHQEDQRVTHPTSRTYWYQPELRGSFLHNPTLGLEEAEFSFADRSGMARAPGIFDKRSKGRKRGP
jgi:hypothetical protein